MDALKAWLFSRTPREGPVVLGIVRIGLGLLWLSNLSWKLPPEFGRGSDGGLYRYLRDAIEHPVFPPYSWLVEHVVVPLFLPFAWMTVLVEAALAVLLLTGTLTRLAAVLGIGQSVAIGLSVAATPNEWPWSYLLMVLAHLALLGSPSVAQPGVDRVLASRSDRVALAVRQLTGWGVAAVLVGVVGAAASLGDPLAGGGAKIGVSEIQVGQYNLLGGIVLALVGAGLFVAGRRHSPGMARAAAVVAALAALSIGVRWGFGAVPLGGNGSSIALFLSLGLVGSLMGWALNASPAAVGHDPIESRTGPAPRLG